MRELLKQCISLGHLTDAFALKALDVARAQINKKRHIPHEIRNDAISDFALKLTRKWKLINPERYPKQYLNRMAHTCIIDILRKFETERKYKTAKLEENEVNSYEIDFDSSPGAKFLPNLMTREDRAQLRKFVIRCLKADVPIIEISRNTGLDRKTIRKWRERHKVKGNMFFREDLRKLNGKKKKKSRTRRKRSR